MKYNIKIVKAFFAEEGLPPLTEEFQFHGERKWRFDFAWPAHKVALEVEGGIFTGGAHTRGAHFKSDMEKYNMAALYGWKVFRCVPDDLCLVTTAAILRLAIFGGDDSRKYPVRPA